MLKESTFRITNPFDPESRGHATVRGRKVVIPKGTVIRTTHPQNGPVRVAKRTQIVTLHHAMWGWIDREYNTEGRVIFPTITWAGASGYWCDVQVTPELAAANSVELPALPKPDEDGRLDGYRLAVIPSYDNDYTNRWETP